MLRRAVLKSAALHVCLYFHSSSSNTTNHYPPTREFLLISIVFRYVYRKAWPFLPVRELSRSDSLSRTRRWKGTDKIHDRTRLTTTTLLTGRALRLGRGRIARTHTGRTRCSGRTEYRIGGEAAKNRLALYNLSFTKSDVRSVGFGKIHLLPVLV